MPKILTKTILRWKYKDPSTICNSAIGVARDFIEDKPLIFILGNFQNLLLVRPRERLNGGLFPCVKQRI